MVMVSALPPPPELIEHKMGDKMGGGGPGGSPKCQTIYVSKNGSTFPKIIQFYTSVY